MPLTLALGPANSAKAGEVLGAFAAASRRGALLVVPTAADAEHYSRELAAQGSVLATVLTFTGLIEEVARRVGYAERRLTSLQRERVVERAVGRARLEALAESARSSGFAPAALELIAELERSLVSVERFAQAMRAWAAEDPRREPYGRDVAAIYLAYARELERLGRVDGELFAWRALDALRVAPGRWGTDSVFFYGFDDLHPLERDAVEALARVVGVEVMVSLTYEAGRVALQARAAVVEELRPLAERVLELPALDEYYEPGSRAVLHYLERCLFEPPRGGAIEPGDAIEPGAAEPGAAVESSAAVEPDDARDPGAAVEPGRTVRLLEAAGERAEAELVAAEVVELLRGGVAAEEIAIVCRSLASSGSRYAGALERFGVRPALARRVPFAHTSLGRALLGLARCALLPADEASPEDLLAYLRAPGLLGRLEVADSLELAVRSDGLNTAAQARERLSFDVDEIDALRQARDPAAELVRHGRRLFAAPHRGDAAVLNPREQLDARALAALARAVGELDELRERIGGRELIELLERVEVPERAAAATDGAVLVTEPLAIRARRFRVVIVCGLQDGEFPRAAAPDPFLSDERRRELAAASGLRLRLREDSLERERYLFYSAVSRATDAVLLSYRSADEEGNLELPSPFISDVAELMVPEWRERRRRRMLADVVWPADQAPTARELARAEAAARAPAGGDPPEPCRVLSETALGYVRHTEMLSAGALETYASCPVKWLVERQLSPRRLEPEYDAIARGSYIHDVLEQLLGRLGRAVTRESLPRALELLDELTAEIPPRIAPGRPERLRRAAVERIAADLRRYLRHEAATGGGWDPAALELRFGFGGGSDDVRSLSGAGRAQDDERSLPGMGRGEDSERSLPALELGEGEERIAVRGAIDRVDVEPGGRRAVVRDYKSGGIRAEYQGGRWSRDGSLQVALYMLAVRDLLGLDPIAGLYQPLSGRDLRARGVYLADAPAAAELVATDARDPEGLATELRDAQASAVAIAARLRAGDLTPCPEKCSRDGCRFPAICRTT